MNASVECVLTCEDVSVRFPIVSSSNRWKLLYGANSGAWHDALNGISLSVPRGKIIGVIGRNGAGKSTLLRTLAGIYPLKSGRVTRLGSVSSLFELGGIGSSPNITGRQYVMRWLRLNGVPRRERTALVEDIRDFSELAERLEDPIYTYSAGMAARLYFSTATSLPNDIYLIDEVLSVGDEHFQSKCWNRVREQIAGGVSGVLVTHDWAAILRLCEHSCELEGGRFIASGDSEKVICDYLKLADQLATEQVARFSEDCPTHLTAQQGADWRCDLPVITSSTQPVFFNYSIEKLVLGHDWQILFMGIEKILATSSGDHLARIEVPGLPLPAGEYRLNLFLNGARPADGGSKPCYDIRSWTTGNSIRLSVTGRASAALVDIPLIVEYA